MKRPHDEYRLAAEHAVVMHMAEHETNFLVDIYVWQTVNAALNAYDEAMDEARSNRTRQAWAVLHENGLPWLVLPTYRLARRQRATLALLSDTPRHRLRIVRTEVADL